MHFNWRCPDEKNELGTVTVDPRTNLDILHRPFLSRSLGPNGLLGEELFQKLNSDDSIISLSEL